MKEPPSVIVMDDPGTTESPEATQSWYLETLERRKQIQGWDMDALLKSGPVRRTAELFCFACVLFDTLCAEWFVLHLIG